MSVLVVIAGAVLNAVIIGFFVRRLLGVPVGWPRTLLLSLAVNFGISPLLAWVLAVLHLAPVIGHSASGPAETAVIAIVILWVLVLEVAALAVLEALAPTGTVPNPVSGLRALPSGARRGVRYAAILKIAATHGLSAYLGRRRTASPEPASALARSLREAFTDAGVTFVKLGQMLSTRPDLLPAPYIAELSRLQTDVPPEPWAAVEPVLQAEWGRPVGDVVAHIDPRPFAAASVAQIHAARLTDGTEVVVKIQRPRARAQVTADLDIVTRLARILDRRAGWAHHLGVRSLAHGFAESLAEELDYRSELANMQAVTAASGDLLVPRPYPELSGRHVLVMQRLAGRPLTEAASVLESIPRDRRLAMAEQLLAAVLRQVLVTGVFHADLHGGNIFLTDGGELALLDFGSVGRLDAGDRMSLSILLAAVDAGDAIAATDSLTDLLDAPDDVDQRRLERDIGQLIMRHGGAVGPGGSAQLFGELFALVLRHRLAVPTPIAAAFRALGALEGSLMLLTGDLDLVATARAEARRIMAEAVTPDRVRETARLQLAAVMPVLQRLPRRISRITDQIETGGLTVNVRAFRHPDDRAFLTGVVQQVVVALLAAALAVGGILLVIADTGPLLARGLRLYTFVGAILLLFAFVLGARALILVFRRDAPVDRE